MELKWAGVSKEQRMKIAEAVKSAADSLAVKLRSVEWKDAGVLLHDQLVLDIEDAVDREEKRDLIIERAKIDPPLNRVVLKPQPDGS